MNLYLISQFVLFSMRDNNYLTSHMSCGMMYYNIEKGELTMSHVRVCRNCTKRKLVVIGIRKVATCEVSTKAVDRNKPACMHFEKKEKVRS